MNQVYVILKQGVYDHGCHGVFTNKERGIKACNEWADLDKDSYHTYKLYEIFLNQIPIKNAVQNKGFNKIIYHVYKNSSERLETKLTNYKQIIAEG